MRQLLAQAAVSVLFLFGLASIPSGWGADLPQVPPEPLITPIAASLGASDLDGNLVEDVIDEGLKGAAAVLARVGATPQERAQAQATLDEPIAVIVTFQRQIAQADLNNFIGRGGAVHRVYQSVLYGWSGTVPRGKAAAAAAAMGQGLAGITLDKVVTAHLHVATRTGQVRQQWTLGYDGDPNITIAILDSGISGLHTDLAGRQQLWRNYVDAAPNPNDIFGHGSHVSGIALGSGAASGVNPATILYSDSEFFRFAVGSFGYGSMIDLPTPNGGAGAANFRWNVNMIWGATGGSRSAGIQFGLYESFNDPITAVNDAGHFTLTAQTSSTLSPIAANSNCVVAQWCSDSIYWHRPSRAEHQHGSFSEYYHENGRNGLGQHHPSHRTVKTL